MKLACLTILSLAASTALAQDLGVKAPPQSKPILITGATVHPISKPAIENGVVHFADGKLAFVGSKAEWEEHIKNIRLVAPETIDASGKHVYPGLIGAQTQLGLTEISAVRAMQDTNEAGSVTPEARAIVAVNPDSTLIPVTRSNGELIAAVFPSGGTIPGRVGVMRLDGWTWEEMAIKPDAGLVVEWPMMRTVTAWWNPTPEEEQLKNIRQNLHVIDKAFATARSYAAARAADPTTPIDLRWEAMIPTLPAAAQTPLFISANAMDQITAAVSWAAPLGLKVVIVGGTEAPMCADLLKTHNVPVIVMGTHNFPRRDDGDFDEAFTLPARLEAAGVRWCLASGEETAHERNLPYNAGRAVAYGLSRDAALRSITLSSAEILGIADQYGSLDAGKSATLIFTDGDPLEVTSHVSAAFIDGRTIDLSNKQTILAEKYRQKYKQSRKN